MHFQGKFHTLSGAQIRPKPLQQPFPKFYLGGGSRQAWEMSAKHSDVHLFWGDLPEKIAQNIAEIREMARAHGRENEIGFGMRLQIICREDEKEAWEAADQLVRHATERLKQERNTLYNNSVANQRVQQLAREHGDLLLPHLWTGITKVRPGAGIAVVGNPAQCADHAAAIHRRRLPLVLPVRLSARRGGRTLRPAGAPDPRRKQPRAAGGVTRKSGRVLGALVGGDLRGQHLPRRLDVDQRIDVEFGRDDIGPFVQDAVKLARCFRRRTPRRRRGRRGHRCACKRLMPRIWPIHGQKLCRRVACSEGRSGRGVETTRNKAVTMDRSVR